MLEARRAVRPWIVWLARIGLAAHGVIYFVVGLVAARWVFLRRGGLADKQEALVFVERQPVGHVLLAAIGVGLVGYVAWRLTQAIWDPERKGTWQRLGSAGIAIAYGGLAAFALRRVAGERVRAGGDLRVGREAGADLLGWPGGRWVLAAIAAAVIAFAVYEVVRAVKELFLEQMRTERMSAREIDWARRLGKVGTIARALVFATLAVGVLDAAWAANAQRIEGMTGALRTLAGGPGGRWLLAFTALGLMAYGLYMTAIEARYRRIAPP
jgi:Domain of Unknown Function (DUF1206)